MKKSATSSVQASGPFRRTFGVGIRAANALPMSILTLAALLLALTLLSAGAPPASAQVDTAATEVEVFADWSLKPGGMDDGVDVGGKFRLLIVTSDRIERQYNSHGQLQRDYSRFSGGWPHGHPAVQSLIQRAGQHRLSRCYR